MEYVDRAAGKHRQCADISQQPRDGMAQIGIEKLVNRGPFRGGLARPQPGEGLELEAQALAQRLAQALAQSSAKAE
jgi:hypothetical protein